jgi:hypothetical protein
MKKYAMALVALLLLTKSVNLSAQTTTSDNDKVRFGLRITPQPTWFTSNDKNNIPSGSVMGFGFGLNLELKLTSVAYLLTGIGGDFEGGKYKLRNEPGSYNVVYWLDRDNNYVQPAQARKKSSIVYALDNRKISTTFLSIPLQLKLLTSEYNGIRYYGLFGGELGIRIAMKSNDHYTETRVYETDSTYVVTGSHFTSTGLNIGEEGSFPIRFGLNAGLGMEYRLGGSTTFFSSVSFFRSFVGVLDNPSPYLYYRSELSGGKETYQFVKSNLRQNAIRISIGLMF